MEAISASKESLMRYVLTVDRAGLDKGETEGLVRIEDTVTGVVETANSPWILGPSRFVVSAEERQDGARAWIETDHKPVP